MKMDTTVKTRAGSRSSPLLVRTAVTKVSTEANGGTNNDSGTVSPRKNSKRRSAKYSSCLAFATSSSTAFSHALTLTTLMPTNSSCESPSRTSVCFTFFPCTLRWASPSR
jgi:hypothetical protein